MGSFALVVAAVAREARGCTGSVRICAFGAEQVAGKVAVATELAARERGRGEFALLPQIASLGRSSSSCSLVGGHAGI